MAVGGNVRVERKRLKDENRFIELVCTAVAEMNKTSGASRQSIVKFVQEKQQKNVSNEVNRALRKAVTEGLLLHSTGSGLNGSFILGNKLSMPSSNILGLNHNLQFAKWETVQSKDARIRKLPTVAGKMEGVCNCSCDNVTQPNKRQRKKKMSHPVCRCRAAKFMSPAGETSTCNSSATNVLQSILKKTKTKRKGLRKSICKLPSSLKKRKVRFARTPQVVFISPRVKRIRKRKRRQSIAL